MIWIVVLVDLCVAACLMTLAWRRGRPGWLVFGLLLLAVFVLLSTVALLRESPAPGA